MDTLAGLLDGPRARGAFLLTSTLKPPWSIRVADEAPLALVAMVRGSGFVVPDGQDPLPLAAGDVMVAHGPDHYTVCDDPATAPQVIILPGEQCAAPDGSDVKPMTDLGIRNWGNDPDGSTQLLTGTYQFDHEVGRRLLDALPPLLVIPAAGWRGPLIPYLADEMARDEPGQQAVLDRLLDLVLIAVLRSWFARPEARAPGWYRAHGDPVAGAALRLMHDDPARPWTLAALAKEIGVSRATLARRFTDLVGESPIGYLTEWRLTLAADLLREPGATVGSVARQVGYGSSFALSTAFKRRHGVSPAQYRAAG